MDDAGVDIGVVTPSGDVPVPAAATPAGRSATSAGRHSSTSAGRHSSASAGRHGSASALTPPGCDATARRTAHARAMRAWIRYSIGLAVVLLVVAGSVAWLWTRGEYRHTHDHPATVAAKELPHTALAARLSEAWHSSDRAVLGNAVAEDVAVTYGGHTVTGRDARTGAERWTYTRTDRQLCSAVTQESVVMAIYAHDGICDEATGLDATTGKRNWTRTLLGDGRDITVVGGQGYYLITRPGSVNLVHAGQTLAGVDAWNDIQPAGCRTRTAVLGNSGVLFASACAGGDKLTYRKLDGDKRVWTVAAAGRSPVAADSGLLVLARDGRSLEELNAKKGALVSRLRLRAAVRPAPQPRGDQLSGVETELVAVAGGTLALSTGEPPVLRWQANTGALDVTVDDGVLTARAGAVYSVATSSGRQVKICTVTGLAAGARLSSLGGGLLADSAAGVTAYR